MDPNSYEAFLRRLGAATLTWRGPALMLFARAACVVGAQALVATVFGLRASPTPWHDAERWLPVYAARPVERRSGVSLIARPNALHAGAT
jgi:hypothetical protein